MNIANLPAAALLLLGVISPLSLALSISVASSVPALADASMDVSSADEEVLPDDSEADGIVDNGDGDGADSNDTCGEVTDESLSASRC